MNALLKFQAQQEDQFLQSILAHDFEQLCAEHVDFFQNNLQPQFDYHQFSKGQLAQRTLYIILMT